jgi:hypothetical protein
MDNPVKRERFGKEAACAPSSTSHGPASPARPADLYKRLCRDRQPHPINGAQ